MVAALAPSFPPITPDNPALSGATGDAKMGYNSAPLPQTGPEPRSMADIEAMRAHMRAQVDKIVADYEHHFPHDADHGDLKFELHDKIDAILSASAGQDMSEREMHSACQHAMGPVLGYAEVRAQSKRAAKLQAAKHTNKNERHEQNQKQEPTAVAGLLPAGQQILGVIKHGEYVPLNELTAEERAKIAAVGLIGAAITGFVIQDSNGISFSARGPDALPENYWVNKLFTPEQAAELAKRHAAAHATHGGHVDALHEEREAALNNPNEHAV